MGNASKENRTGEKVTIQVQVDREKIEALQVAYTKKLKLARKISKRDAAQHAIHNLKL